MFDGFWCDCGALWAPSWSYVGLSLSLSLYVYTIQKAKQNQIPQIAKISTAPWRELKLEGSTVLKMAPKSTTYPSEMDTHIVQKTDHMTKKTLLGDLRSFRESIEKDKD